MQGFPLRISEEISICSRLTNCINQSSTSIPYLNNIGKYRSAEEALEIALRLLDEYDRADAEWIEDVREKIDAAILASDKTPPIDGETFVNQVIERFRQGHQAQA